METDDRLFDYIFKPRAVAIIGASPHDGATLAQMTTKIWDRLFLVNPKYTEILGKKCYPNILEVEGEIDYAIFRIAASALPQALEECIQKGVKVAQIYTAGFSETGIPERIEQEKELQQQAAGRIRLIGPNCFGVYCPQSGLRIISESPTEGGHIGVVSQSGGVTESFSYFATTKNLRFSKVISYGNAIDLDGADFLECLAEDPETKVIAFYVEGTNNAGRLKAALTKAAGRKPVVVIKGGMTEQGTRAVASHTASLAGSPKMWQALFRQTGALQVESFEDMVNAVTAFDKSPLPEGPAIAFITNSGGFSVIQTDLCLKAGIEIPRFTPETLAALRALVPAAGTSIENPLDAWPIFYNIAPTGNIADIIKIASRDRNIQSLVFHFDQFRYLRRVMGRKVDAHMQRLTDLIVTGCLHARDNEKKPVLITVSLDPYFEDEEDRRYNLLLKRALEAEDFPVYASLDGAIKALANLHQYRRRCKQPWGMCDKSNG